MTSLWPRFLPAVSSLLCATSSHGPCAGNTASTRSQWCGLNVSTDYTTTVPDTGVTREYWLELGDVTVALDGVNRTAMAVNGTIPGPTLFADWGDTVVVHLTNSLRSTNGTSMHFHGLRQNFTNQQDGVASVTQCPTAPGATHTYRWRATQYGTTWYHSHWALQAWQGFYGGLVINGPATANYDEDVGVLFLTDWDNQTVDQLYPSAETVGPPTLANGLINGTNVRGQDGTPGQTGSRFRLQFKAGTRYRIRLINGAVDTHWKFSIDNHTMTVISTDLVPINPYNTTVLSIAMAQRYDIIVTADQAATATAFWMRAVPQSACSSNNSTDNIKGIVTYGGDRKHDRDRDRDRKHDHDDANANANANVLPTTKGYALTDDCKDEPMNKLVPHVRKTVGAPTYSDDRNATVNKVNGLFKWFLNSTTLLTDWDAPTLLQVVDGNSTYSTGQAIVELDHNEWVYMVIQTTLPVPHPIHLHGFDFFVLAQGTGAYSSEKVALKTNNPPRRDTALLPANGYLVIAFQADNPGCWLMHCHIGWHTSEGFGMQWVVRKNELAAITDAPTMRNTCSAWSQYAATAKIRQHDSGI